jgi:hypothetical protein
VSGFSTGAETFPIVRPVVTTNCNISCLLSDNSERQRYDFLRRANQDTAHSTKKR